MSVQATAFVIKYSKQKGSPLLLLLMIANYAHADGTNAYPSIETLAKDCRMSGRQITRMITILENSGELIINRSYGRTANFYSINMNPDILSPLEERPTLTNPSRNPDKSSTPTLTNPSKNLEHIRNEPLENHRTEETTFPDDPIYEPCDSDGLPLKQKKKASRFEKRDRLPRSIQLVKPAGTPKAVRMVEKLMGRRLDKVLWDDIVADVGDDPDEALLAKCRAYWLGRGWKENATKWTEYYRKGIPVFDSLQPNGNGRAELTDAQLIEKEKRIEEENARRREETRKRFEQQHSR